MRARRALDRLPRPSAARRSVRRSPRPDSQRRAAASSPRTASASPGEYAVGLGQARAERRDRHEQEGCGRHASRGSSRTSSAKRSTSRALDDVDAIPDWLAGRVPGLVTWEGWQAIDAHEQALGEPHGRPRVKVVRVPEMIALAERGRVRLGGASARRKRQLEREAAVGVVERRPEQLAQSGDAVAHGLRVDVQLLGDRGAASLVAQPRRQRLEQSSAARRRLRRRAARACARAARRSTSGRLWTTISTRSLGRDDRPVRSAGQRQRPSREVERACGVLDRHASGRSPIRARSGARDRDRRRRAGWGR